MFTAFCSCYPAEGILAETALLMGSEQLLDSPVSLTDPVQVLILVQEWGTSLDRQIFTVTLCYIIPSVPFSHSLRGMTLNQLRYVDTANCRALD